MAKASKAATPKSKLEARDDETRKEINKQHELLYTDLDKKSLRGNVTVEDWRYVKHSHNLSKKEKRGQFEIKTERTELLKDLKKVRSNYTGHYDDSKSPIENIQQALRAKCMTPARNSRLGVQGLTPVRRCRSQETLIVEQRPLSTLGYNPTRSEIRGNPPRLTKRPQTVHSMRPVEMGSPTLNKKSAEKGKKSGTKTSEEKYDTVRSSKNAQS